MPPPPYPYARHPHTEEDTPVSDILGTKPLRNGDIFTIEGINRPGTNEPVQWRVLPTKAERKLEKFRAKEAKLLRDTLPVPTTPTPKKVRL